MALINCSECGKEISDAAMACPHCGKPIMGAVHVETPSSEPAGQAKPRGNVFVSLVIWGILIFGLMWACVPDEDTPEERAERAAKAEEDRRKGFHCLSAWDGSHPEFKRLVVANLRDPESFEHIETRVAPVQDGMHRIVMDYRARNGFGGMVVGQAAGTYANTDCADVTLSHKE